MDSSSTYAERRLFQRKRVLKGGRIVFNRSSSTINCTMSNHSDGGARLEVTSILGIPAAFDLKLDGYPSRACGVIWRRGNAVGVAFTSF